MINQIVELNRAVLNGSSLAMVKAKRKESQLNARKRAKEERFCLEKEDRIINEIEKRSRDPFGHNTQGVSGAIDVEILRGYMDEDEIDNEERIGRHSRGPYRPLESIEHESALGSFAGAKGNYFPEHLHDKEYECECSGDEQCQICCTEIDLSGVPKELIRIVGSRPRIVAGVHVGDEYEVQMLFHFAEMFGLVEAMH